MPLQRQKTVSHLWLDLTCPPSTAPAWSEPVSRRRRSPRPGTCRRSCPSLSRFESLCRRCRKRRLKRESSSSWSSFDERNLRNNYLGRVAVHSGHFHEKRTFQLTSCQLFLNKIKYCALCCTIKFTSFGVRDMVGSANPHMSAQLNNVSFLLLKHQFKMDQ